MSDHLHPYFRFDSLVVGAAAFFFAKQFVWVGVVLAVLLGDVTDSLGKPIARETQLGDAVQLIENDAGGAVLETFRIYRYVDMRYFVAGVGEVERQATYPNFPLKLVFSGPGGVYLALVAATIINGFI